MSPVTVRRRTEADLDACVEMARVIHALDGYPAYLPTDLRTFLDSSEALAAWVAEDAGTVVGHVSLHRRSSAAVMDLAVRASHQPPGRLGVVARLLVDPTARRAGVGRALLDRAASEARARHLRPVLDVATDMTAAIRLYESCGWTRAGEVTAHFPDGTSLDEFVYLAPVDPAPVDPATVDLGSSAAGVDRFPGRPPEVLDAHLDAVLIGGREERLVEIVGSTPAWSRRFATEKLRLAEALGPRARRIEHIGSTAVPGLAAKPVVDIMVTVDDPDDEAPYRPALEAAGYLLRVREPGHRLFRTPAGNVHVHIWAVGSPDEHRQLAFRDWLRAHPDDREEYERVKRSLSGRYTDTNYYAEAKTPIIESILAKALGQGGP